jgi:hypothetical protein
MNTLPQVMREVSGPEIESRIFLIRGHKVLIDKDLAELYGVPTKALNQAVKRNIQRFPDDFLFQLTLEEGREILRSQIVTLEIDSRGNPETRGRHSKYAPYAFTELGVAMLSSVLGSERAILANISIMRTFVRIRQTQLDQVELGQRLGRIEWRQDEQGEQIRAVFETIEHLIESPPEKDRKRIGFPTSMEHGNALAIGGV